MTASPAPASARRMRRGLAAAALALLALVGCSTLDEQQRRWIFQPSDRAWGNSATAAQDMQDVWIEFVSRETGAPTRLHGLWLPGPRADSPALLYLHGARWDVRGSAHRMRRMHALGFAVLGIDYRGFGQSTAELPSEATAYEDARAAWDWLAARDPAARRFVFGHSLGAAIAVHLATEADGVAGLMVEGAFTSIPDVVSTFRWGWLPVAPLITQRFDAAARIGRARAPVLVVHGSEDRLIPPALGRALYERAAEPKRFVLVEGGTHHNTNALAQADYREALAALFDLDGGRTVTSQRPASSAEPPGPGLRGAPTAAHAVPPR